MSPIEALKLRINNVIDDWSAEVDAIVKEHEKKQSTEAEPSDIAEPAEVPVEEPTKPEGKRVVRASTTGDRVYYIDEDKKTRSWVTNPEVLRKLGFGLEDVAEVTEEELLRYNMAPAIYKIDE